MNNSKAKEKANQMVKDLGYDDQVYLVINHKNNIQFFQYEEMSIINILSRLDKSLDEAEIYNEMEDFLDNFFPLFKGNNNFNITKCVLRIYCKTNKLNREEAEDSITYLTEKIIKYNNNPECFIFNKESIITLGKLVLYSYKKFDDYKIKTVEYLNEKIKLTGKVDVMKDYNDFISKNAKKKFMTRNQFWKENSKNYQIPPEFIFIMNTFKNYKKIKMEIENYNQSESYLLSAIFLNINYIFQNVTDVYIDFSNSDCLLKIYERLQKKMDDKEKERGKYIKPLDYKKEFLNHKIISFHSTYINQTKREKEEDISDSEKQNSSNNTNNKTEMTKAIMEENIGFLESLLLTSFYLSKFESMSKLTLIFSDFFTREINWGLYLKYNVEINKNFHILNNLLLLRNRLTYLKIAFNSIDPEGFLRILILISRNQNLQKLYLSFFAFDINYLSAGLYKLGDELLQDNKKKLFEKQTLLGKENGDIINLDYKIISNLIEDFENNLFILFLLIKDNKIINDLALFFDTPSIINSNEKYSMVLTKFLFNMLLLLNSNKVYLVKLILLFPYLVLDNRRFPSIADFFDDIDNNNNSTLTYFHLQVQLLHVPNVHKILNQNLMILTIGDFDVVSFRNFVKNIANPKFINDSSLQEINIGFLVIIDNFRDIKNEFNQLVSIKTKKLETFSFYTHFIFKNITLYFELMNCIQFKWIGKYNFKYSIRTKNNINNFKEFYVYLKYKKYLNYLQNFEDKGTVQMFDLIKKIYFLKGIKNKNIKKTFNNKGIFNICSFLFKSSPISLNEEFW